MLSARSIFIIAAALLTAATLPAAQAQEAQELAPTGKLRVGVYLGSPTSMVRDAATGETRGMSVELGRELARRLNVPYEQVTYPRVAEVIEGMKAGAVDFTVTNATPARAQDVAFSQTLISIELGYLVPAASPIRTAADLDKPGTRIGVTKGSTSERTLPGILKQSAVVPAPTLKDAIAMLGRGELDAFATNKAILFEMSDEMTGARILAERWGVEHLGVAIPKDRERGLELVRRFVDEARSSGLVAQSATRAGLRGTTPAE